MSSPDSKTTWQSTFDTDYPLGLILEWDDQRDHTYLVPRVEVLDMIEADPVVRLDVFNAYKSFVLRITGYTVVAREPVSARVVGHNLDALMLWNADVPADVAAAMRDNDW